MDEKVTQGEVYEFLLSLGVPFEPEHELMKGSIIDFLIAQWWGIEVKIKGSKRQIYRQCERYCSCPDLQGLILLSSVSIGFPKEINGKPCYVINMSKAWL